MAVTGNHPWLALSLLVIATAAVSSASIPGSNETWRPAAPINCTAFNASSPCLSPDLDKQYCLENGWLVTGQCAVQRALCLNNISVEADSSICTNSISDAIPQRPREGLDSSTRTSTTASTPVSSSRASLSAAGRGFFDEAIGGFFGEAVAQFDGASLTSTRTTTRVDEKTSASSSTTSSTRATLLGSNKDSSQVGEASSNTRTTPADAGAMSLSTDARASSLFSDTTSATTAGRQVTTTISPFNNSETFTNNEKTFNMTATSTANDRNQFTSSRAPITNNETLTNNEQTFNTSGPSFNNDKNPFSSVGAPLENNGRDSTNVDLTPFNTSKQLGSDQTLPDDKTLSETGGSEANGNNTASILGTATWHVSLASLSLAIVYAGHHLIIC